MRPWFLPGTLAFVAAPLAFAGTICPAGSTSGPAARAIALRRTLQSVAVRSAEETVPVAVSKQLTEFKAALAATAEAAFACTAVDVSPEQLQTTLADALHANSAVTADITTDPRTGLEKGVYGANLAVQVFELFGAPRIFEVDFRYNIACGDDHLLLTFETPGGTSATAWHEQLRYGTPVYRTVGDALGDFVLLTPLTGDDQHRTWHYLLAHGHPACKETPRPSTFDLDLLTPAGNPGSPAIDWHFTHPYTAGNSIPRLATTEDTVDFRLTPSPPVNTPEAGPPPVPAIFRFRYTASGHVEPLPAQAGEGSTSPSTPGSATAH